MNADRPMDKDGRLALTILCVVSGLVLFAFRATELSGMSAAFASSVAKDEWVFFSHHLLYQPAINLLGRILAPAGCDAVCAGQVHSIAWALVAIACTFIIILRLTDSVLTALTGGLLLAVSHNFWVFATQVEPYVPLVAMNALIATIVLHAEKRALTTVELILCTIIFTFSLFFHQANVFFLLPLALYLGLTVGPRGLLDVVKIASVAGILALSVNVLAYWTTHADATLHGFRLWLTFYAVVSDDSHGTWRALLTLDPERLKQAGRSLVAAIVTTPSDALRTPVRVAVTAVLALVFLWNVAYVAKRRPGTQSRVFLLAWAATFVLFFSWWHANVHKFFLTATIPLIILCVLTVRDLIDSTERRSGYRAALVTILIGTLAVITAVNFDRSIRPMTGDGSGILRVSQKLAEAASASNCMLYTKRRFSASLSLYGLVDQFRTYQTMYVKHHFSPFNTDIGEAFKMTTDVAEDACNVILLDWLSYEDFQFHDGDNLGMRRAQAAKLSEAGRPSWPGFIAWILDVRPVADGSGVSYNPMTFFRIQSGETFVRINRRTRATAPSLDSILEALDASIENDARLDFTRREHGYLNDFRNRVFGYS